MEKTNVADTDNIKKTSTLEEDQKVIDKAPFHHLKITNAQILNTIEGRKICERCNKSRKFFCYTCYIPVISKEYFPTIKVLIIWQVENHSGVNKFSAIFHKVLYIYNYKKCIIFFYIMKTYYS